ncbi:hypothetical protein WBG78_30515 [Chryseolinea sp. T2]|uniref:hypothetical protein n=1 Tax=Chryseolinea sp. T2 TaxID=3129255 RepID=UPI0030787D94
MKFWVFFGLFISTATYSQTAEQKSVVIGKKTDHPNALLIVNPPNADQGVLLPQITSQNRNAMRPSSPNDDGLIVFDTTEKSFYCWINNSWVKGLGASLIQDLTITGNILSLTNDITSVDLSGISLTGTNIIDGTIGANDIANSAITPLKIQPGGSSTVLSTDGGGIVKWLPAKDAQDLALTGNTLSLTNDASPVNLNSLIVSGQLSGPLNGVSLTNNSVTSMQIKDGAVTLPKLATSGTADGNKIFTTNPMGVPQLESKSGILNNIPANGDLSGNYPSPDVVKIRGNAIASGILGTSDNGKILVWDGVRWTPQIIPSLSPISKYYMVDPSDFTGTKGNGPKDHDNRFFLESENRFVTVIKRNEGTQLIAPIHLADGLTIQEFTLYYWDEDPTNLTFSVFRRSPTGGNENVITPYNSSGSSSTIRTITQSTLASTNVIDNSQYSYRIVIDLNPDQDINNLSEASQRIYGVRIKYQ